MSGSSDVTPPPTHAELRFQTDIDDMVQDFAAADLERLAAEVVARPHLVDDPALAPKVADELRRRSDAGVLYWPRPATIAAGPVPDDADIPW